MRRERVEELTERVRVTATDPRPQAVGQALRRMVHALQLSRRTHQVPVI
jgi:hypothetical protein